MTKKSKGKYGILSPRGLQKGKRITILCELWCKQTKIEALFWGFEGRPPNTKLRYCYENGGPVYTLAAIDVTQIMPDWSKTPLSRSVRFDAAKGIGDASAVGNASNRKAKVTVRSFKYTEAQIKEVAEGLLSGLNGRDVAELTGITQSYTSVINLALNERPPNGKNNVGFYNRALPVVRRVRDAHRKAQAAGPVDVTRGDTPAVALSQAQAQETPVADEIDIPVTRKAARPAQQVMMDAFREALEFFNGRLLHHPACIAGRPCHNRCTVQAVALLEPHYGDERNRASYYGARKKVIEVWE